MATTATKIADAIRKMRCLALSPILLNNFTAYILAYGSEWIAGHLS